MEQQPYQFTKGQIAVERAKMPSDNIVLGVTFGVFFLLTCGWIVYLFFTGMSDVPGAAVGILGFLFFVLMVIVFFGILLGIGMLLVRITRHTVLGNSMEVQYSSYAWLRDWANTVAADLQMPEVEIFVTQDPMINAYAIGFARPYIIVLHSGSIRYLTKDELKVVVVHEMAHIKYHHTNALVYLQPFLSIPVISVLGSWIAGFWQRRTEYTADRLALMYLEDADLVKNSLVKVHVGPDTASDMNDVARQWQQYKTSQPMNRFSQTFSTHPFLVRRLEQVDYWDSVLKNPQPQVYQQQVSQPMYAQSVDANAPQQMTQTAQPVAYSSPSSAPTAPEAADNSTKSASASVEKSAQNQTSAANEKSKLKSTTTDASKAKSFTKKPSAKSKKDSSAE